MGGIIIAMPKLEDANRISDIIRRSNIWEEPVTCNLGSEILRLVRERDIELVICTRKFTDMSFQELSDYLPSNVNMILLTKDASLIPYSSNIVRLLMPFKSSDLIDTVNMFIPVRRGKPKPKKPKRSEEEQQLIDKAKMLLMDRNDMSEPDAFRYIQKTSMDTGRSMLESAQMILMMN